MRRLLALPVAVVSGLGLSSWLVRAAHERELRRRRNVRRAMDRARWGS